MQDKIPVLIVYGLLGLLLAIAPLVARPPRTLTAVGPAVTSQDLWLRGSPVYVWIVVALLLLSYALGPHLTRFILVLVAISLGAGLLRRSSAPESLEAGTATLLACAVGATLPWWLRQAGMSITTGELIRFGSLLAIAGSILLASKAAISSWRWEWPAILSSYCAIAAYLSFSLAGLATHDPVVTAWHHWGAYIGPSESVATGARVFYDIPAQYGAGPTAILAVGCKIDCWRAAYWVFAVSAFAYSMLIGLLAWSMRSGARYRDLLLLLVCIVACNFWTAYPPEVASPLMTPSADSMRFLPAVVLAAWAVLFDERYARIREWGGHTLWVFGVLWSPESAFYATAVWWPVYLFDHVGAGALLARCSAMLRACAKLFALAIGTVTVFVLVYRFAYGVLPEWRYWLAYALYPPGVMPIDPHGDIWFFGCVLAWSVALSWWAWKCSGDDWRFRRSMVLQLLALSTFSYFLGRSHDNNILNLMPFLVLLLIDGFNNAARPFSRYFLAFSLAMVVAWMGAFGWGVWGGAWKSGKLMDFAVAQKLGLFAYDQTSPQSDQLQQLIGVISKRGEPYMMVSLWLPLYDPHNVWSALNGPENFPFIPPAMRREFLQRTAQHLQRDGWLIVDRTDTSIDPEPWLADYDAVYQRTDRIDLPAYYAIRYAWRPSGKPIATH